MRKNLICSCIFALKSIALSRKIMVQCRLCPAKLWSNAEIAHKITEPLFFALQNYGDFVLCPAKFWSNADFSPQNCGDIVSGANKYPQIYVSSLFF